MREIRTCPDKSLEVIDTTITPEGRLSHVTTFVESAEAIQNKRRHGIVSILLEKLERRNNKNG